MGRGLVPEPRLGSVRPDSRCFGAGGHPVSESLGRRRHCPPDPAPEHRCADGGPRIAWSTGGRAAAARRLPPAESELLRLYERVQRRLGRRRAPPETPLEYWLAQSLPRLRRGDPGGGEVQLLEELTAAVNQGAYAGRWPDPTRVRELSKRLS